MIYNEAAKKVRLIIFDVDGIMTDGRLYLSDDGSETKAFHALDGHGLRMLQDSGVRAAIITGRTSKLVEHRAKNLNIDLVYQGSSDKLASFNDLLSKTGLQAHECAYMGDDVIDLPVMRRVALAITVPHASNLMRQHAHVVTQAPAGFGAVREACELIMHAQGTFDAIHAWYLR